MANLRVSVECDGNIIKEPEQRGLMELTDESGKSGWQSIF